MSPSTIAQRTNRSHDLMIRVARRPRFCCGCFCLSPADRARARRVFALVRKLLAARVKALSGKPEPPAVAVIRKR